MIEPGDGSPRWEAYSHEEILAMVWAGPGPAASLYAAGRWEATWFTVSYIEANLARSVAEAGSGWAGQAADAMTAGTTPLGLWAGRAAEQARSTAKTIDAQAGYAEYTRREMPPAAHPEIPAAPARGPRPYLSGVPIMTDWAAVERDRAAATARARDLMATYGRNSYDTLPGMLAAQGPPSVVVQNTATGTLRKAGATVPAGIGPSAATAGGSGPAGSGPRGAELVPAGLGPAGTGGAGPGSGGSGPGASGTGGAAAGAGSGGSGPGAVGVGSRGPGRGAPGTAGGPSPDAGSVLPRFPGDAGARPTRPGDAGSGGREPPVRSRVPGADGPVLRDRTGGGPSGGGGGAGVSATGDGTRRGPGPLTGSDGFPNGLRGPTGPLGDPAGGVPRGPLTTGPPTGPWGGRAPANPLPDAAVIDRGSPERPFPSSGPAAGRTAGEGLLPMGAGGMGRARGEEHRRPSYLVDDGSAFADDRRIPGSVINEGWPDV